MSKAHRYEREGHLVEDFHGCSLRWRVFHCQLNAARSVRDVNEGAGLAAGAVHREGDVEGGLHEEAVEHRAVVAVVVEAVDEALVLDGLWGVRAPHDPLEEVGAAEAVVFVVKLEEQRVEALGGVVN